MTVMTRSIKIALLAALPVEFVNFFVLLPPIKGYTEGHPTSLEQLRDIEWTILHWPGSLLLPWALDVPHIGLLFGFLVMFLSGYLDTALLIIAGIYGFRWLRRWGD